MEIQEELEKINTGIREMSEEEMQLKHRLVREKNKAAYQKRRTNPEYKARTHSLIVKGGVFEHFYPESNELTDQELYEVMDSLHQITEVRIKIELAIKSALRKRREDNGPVSLHTVTPEEE